MARYVGYARVSTEDQDTIGQRQALEATGCLIIYEDVGSGASRTRPALTRCLAGLSEGDTLIVTRLDRLARSVKHLYEVIEDLDERKVAFRSLRETFDTATPSGRLMLGLLTSIAQFERELIHERSIAGIAAAKARGVRFGNPAMRRRDQRVIDIMKATKADTILERTRTRSKPWIDIVIRMRPDNDWKTVQQYIARKMPLIDVPPVGTMIEMTRRLVKAGDLGSEVMNRSPSPQNKDAQAVAKRIANEVPGISLRAIGEELMLLGVTPARATLWSPQTVSRLINKGKS